MNTMILRNKGIRCANFPLSVSEIQTIMVRFPKMIYSCEEGKGCIFIQKENMDVVH